MSGRCRWLALVVVAMAAGTIAFASAPPAQAEELGAEELAAAREMFTRAVGLVDEGRFDEALEIFEELEADRPHPVLLYNIAWCLSRLGRLQESADRFDAYLASDDESTERREAAELERARLGEVLSSIDRESEEDDLEEAPAEPPRRPVDSRRRLARGWFWGLLGVTLATGAGMTATGATTLVLSDRWIQEGDVADRDTGRRLRLATDVLLITAVAEAVATLVVGLLTDFRAHGRAEPATD